MINEIRVYIFRKAYEYIKEKINKFQNRKYDNKIVRHNKKCMQESDDVLFIRMDGIGDFVLWLDSMRGWCDLYQNQKKVLVCGKNVSSIAESTGYFDEVLGVDTSVSWSVKEKKNLCRQLKKYSGCTLIQCVRSKTDFIDVLVSMIPAKKKITLDTDFRNQTEHNKRKHESIYDIIIPSEGKFKMELIRNAEYVRNLGNEKFQAGIPILPSTNYEIGDLGEYYVLVPSTSSVLRNCNSKDLRHIIHYINDVRPEYNCVILGGNAEKDICDYIESICKNISIINLAGKTNYMEYIEVIRNARFVFSGDTSAVHIAFVCNVPSVCVAGGWEYGRFFPYVTEKEIKDMARHEFVVNEMECFHCDHRNYSDECKLSQKINNRYACIQNIEVDSIIEKIALILENERIVR